MIRCDSCDAELETPLACTRCGALRRVEPPPSPFEALGVPRAFELDVSDLKQRLLRFTRLTHPDFHGTAESGTRELAERNSAVLNEAFRVLSDPVRRADRLVRDLGGPSEQEERQMPQAFLMEVLEWNEALEEARGAEPGTPERARLDALHGELAERRDGTLRGIGAALDPLPAERSDLARTRRLLNAVRYLDRALDQIDELRLGQESSQAPRS